MAYNIFNPKTWFAKGRAVTPATKELYGSAGETKYYRQAKSDGGYDFFKGDNFGISQADADKEISAYTAPAPNPQLQFGTTNPATAKSARTLPAYNVTPTWDEQQATSKAEAAFNPYYDTLIGKENEAAALTAARANEDFSTASQLETEALARFAEQAGIMKGRNIEDLKAQLADLLAQRGEKRAETNYDRIRQNRQLVSELAGSGLQFGGMAARAGSEARQGQTLARNQAKRLFAGAESGAKLQSARGLEDISLSEKARTAASEAAQKNLAKTKERQLADAEKIRLDNIYKLNEARKTAVAEAVSSDYQKAMADWEQGYELFKAQYGF